MSEKSMNTIMKIIDNAEEVHNPLDELLEKTTDNPRAPFEPAVVAALAALRSDDPAAFESLRQKLKKAGARVIALDKAIARENGGPERRDAKQADILISIAEEAELFHIPDNTGFADIMVNGHRETWPIKSKGFRQWLARLFYEETEGAPNSEALQSALNLFEARAHFDGSERKVFIRVANHEGKLYLDLCNPQWQAVEIGSEVWRIVDEPPIRFKRSAGMQEIPEPKLGGSVDLLRPYLNLDNNKDFVLVVSWLLAVLRDCGPYPVLVLAGEQGSAKSTFSAILQSLVDPNSAPLRTLPREDRDFFIATTNAHLLTFDNVSGLAPWASDTICRLATGGGFAIRQLYTDQDEVLFEAVKPILINGIDDFVTRPDLADRAIFLTLKHISEKERKPEKELWASFERDRPLILGALLGAVSTGLRLLPETRLDTLPRMADFYVWATACETALWERGAFQAAYANNQEEAVSNVVESDLVASAVESLMDASPHWSGTATQLLEALGKIKGENITKTKAWPKMPQMLSAQLRRATTFLRKVGIEIDTSRSGGSRIITISKSTSDKSENDPKPAGNNASHPPSITCEMLGIKADDYK